MRSAALVLAALAHVACTSTPTPTDTKELDAGVDANVDWFARCVCAPPSPGFEFGCVARCDAEGGSHTVTCNQRAGTCFSQRFGVLGAMTTPRADATGCDICRHAVNAGGLGAAIFAPADAGARDAAEPDIPWPDVVPGDRPTFDIPREAAPPARRGLYAQCRSDADCTDNTQCLTESASGLPGGQCNRACQRDEDCEYTLGGAAVDGYCEAPTWGGPARCWPGCDSSADCEGAGYACMSLQRVTGVRACQPICTDASCIQGTVCDHDTGRCRAANAAPAGSPFGAPCPGELPQANARCRSGRCTPEYTVTSTGARRYTGWNGGSCAARCILPPGTSMAVSTPDGVPARLPQANCPAGAVCRPTDSLQAGDVGTCVQSCARDTDCRIAEGYVCLTTLRLTSTQSRPLATPFCIPSPCGTGEGCPSGFTCRAASSGSTTMVCVRNG